MDTPHAAATLKAATALYERGILGQQDSEALEQRPSVPMLIQTFVRLYQ